MEQENIKLLEVLGNNQVQDILDELGLIDENGNCPHTAEEIFKEGIGWTFDKICQWLKENVDLEHDYPMNADELINDIKRKVL